MTGSSEPVPPRVLIVDDDAAVLGLLAEILLGEGCDVRTAGSGAEAFRILEEVQGQIDLLVLDIGLPDTDGNLIALAAAKRYGERPVVFVTGWVDEFIHLSDVPGRWALLHKPIAIRNLFDAIQGLGVLLPRARTTGAG